jgi:hypothetical protein
MEAIGRPPDEVTISIHMETRLGAPLDSGRRWSSVGDGYGDRRPVAGDVDHIVETLAPYREEGLEHVLLVPLATSDAEWRESVEGMAEVAGKLRET